MLIVCSKCVYLVDHVDPWSDAQAKVVLTEDCACHDHGCAYPCATLQRGGKLVQVRRP